MVFAPKFLLSSVTEITPEFLQKYRICGLLLDLDNTLTTHNNPVPAEGVLDWIARMKRAGIRLMIVSNNSRVRVKPFSELLGIDFVPRGMKPMTFGFTKAMKRMGLTKRDTAVVGDQLFTDILGANIKGIRTIYVFPIQEEDGPFFRLKRKLEKPVLKGRAMTKTTGKEAEL